MRFSKSIAFSLHAGLTPPLFLSGIDETDVSSGCATSVSVFSIDYDAPTLDAQPVQLQLLPIIGKSQLA